MKNTYPFFSSYFVRLSLIIMFAMMAFESSLSYASEIEQNNHRISPMTVVDIITTLVGYENEEKISAYWANLQNEYPNPANQLNPNHPKTLYYVIRNHYEKIPDHYLASEEFSYGRFLNALLDPDKGLEFLKKLGEMITFESVRCGPDSVLESRIGGLLGWITISLAVTAASLPIYALGVTTIGSLAYAMNTMMHLCQKNHTTPLYHQLSVESTWSHHIFDWCSFPPPKLYQICRDTYHVRCQHGSEQSHADRAQEIKDQNEKLQLEMQGLLSGAMEV